MTNVWADYEIVQYIPLSPPVVVAGETHTEEASGRLVADVLSSKDWSAVCVELCASRLGYQGQDEPPSIETVHSNPGFTEVVGYAHETETPLALVDVPESVTQRRVERAAATTPSLSDTLERLNANISPAENGDVELSTIEEYLRKLEEELPDVYDVVHGHRDTAIAKHVARVQSTYDGPILVVVGAAHVIPLAEAFWAGLQDTETGHTVPVYYDDEHSFLEGTEETR